jgi:hypothetical protein
MAGDLDPQGSSDYEDAVYAEIEGIAEATATDEESDAADSAPTVEADDLATDEVDDLDAKEEGDGKKAILPDSDKAKDGKKAILLDDEADKDEKPAVKETVAERLAATQKKMHLATMEAAEIRKERDSLRKERDDYAQKYKEAQDAIDNGKPIKSSELLINSLSNNLPPRLKEFVGMNPEVLELAAYLSGKHPDAKPVIQEPQQQQNTPKAPSPEEQAWMDTVLEQCPDFLEDQKTPEFAEFLETKKSLVAAISTRYNNLDPVGAMKLHSNFLKYKSEKATMKKPESTARVSGRNISQPSGSPEGMRRSRSAIEEEFEKSL